MPDFTQLIVAVAEALATRRKPETGRLAGLVLVLVLGTVCALAALGCALAALWIYAAPLAGRAGAPLLVALVLLLLVLAAGTTAWALRRPRNPPPDPLVTAERLLAEVARITQAHGIPMLVLALAAGVAAGSRSR